MMVGNHSFIRRSIASENTFFGFSAGTESSFEDSMAVGNSLDGFVINRATVQNCIARGNGRSGFLGGKSIFTYSSAESNSLHGFQLIDGELSDCSAIANTSNGIFILGEAIVKGAGCQLNGGHGIDLERGSITESFIAINAGHGIKSSLTCMVSDSTSINNLEYGINLGPNSMVNGCTVRVNNNNGIAVGAGSIVSSCTSTENGTHGILAGEKSLIKGCTVSSNNSIGIQFASECKVLYCTVSGSSIGAGGASSDHSILKGDTFIQNSIGLTVGNQCLVQGNNSSGNTSIGFVMSSDCMVKGNIGIENPTTGIEVQGSRNRIENNHIVGIGTGTGINGTLGCNNVYRGDYSESHLTDYNILSASCVVGEENKISFISSTNLDGESEWVNFL
ncbi:MAG: hypothetical protein GKR87_03250 [Kiritimatiellae bacterium]|nr:hypothetical protein [Kiritimatiellia bacterium]